MYERKQFFLVIFTINDPLFHQFWFSFRNSLFHSFTTIIMNVKVYCSTSFPAKLTHFWTNSFQCKDIVNHPLVQRLIYLIYILFLACLFDKSDSYLLYCSIIISTSTQPWSTLNISRSSANASSFIRRSDLTAICFRTEWGGGGIHCREAWITRWSEMKSERWYLI